jgi:hypothetical protein
MKVFIFSRRFLIPFFIVWIFTLGYLTWEFWELYRADFTGKGFRDSVIAEWLITLVGGKILYLSFLLALLAGVTFHSHYNSKRKVAVYMPFSKVNILAIIVLALAGFIYMSFYEPLVSLRNKTLLSNIIYSGSDEELQSLQKDTLPATKHEITMTLSELYEARGIIANRDDKARLEGYSMFIRPERIRYEIAKKTGVPFMIICVYALGVLLGISFRRLPRIVPLAIAYLFLYGALYYCDQYFRVQYFGGNTGILLGANGVTLIFGVLSIIWYFILRRSGFFKSPLPEVAEDVISISSAPYK